MTMREMFSFMGWTSTLVDLAAPYKSGEQRVVVVELDDLDHAGRGGVEAQAAEDALVDVAPDDLDAAAVVLGEDVDGAGVGQRAGQLGIPAGLVVDLDRDERPVDPHRALPPAAPAPAGVPVRSSIAARIMSGMSSIRSATEIPAWASRAIFSEAVSSLPSTIVPACPKLMPGISSMKRPAMNATIGSLERFSVTHRASSASMRPPGSV